MKKLLIVAIILLLAVLMTQMVPDKQAHKEAMMEAVTEFVDEEAEQRGFGDNVLTNLGKGVVLKTIETALNSKLKVDNYFILNTTHVRLKGKDQILSLGIFGHVFTFDKEMLREKLEEATKVKEEAVSEKEAAKQSARTEAQGKGSSERAEAQRKRTEKRTEAQGERSQATG